MRVHVYCTDPAHRVFPYLQRWVSTGGCGQGVALVTQEAELTGADILFLVSVGKLVGREIRDRYQATIVLHASDLPSGRGWSPVVWQILNGAKSITVTALSAEDEVDSGDIWAQQTIEIEEHELCGEINHKLFMAEISLMEYVMENFKSINPKPQQPGGGNYFRKRTPEDSRLDPHRTIAEQFDLLRVCDPERYPAFVEFRGHRYRILIEKLD